MSSADSQLLPWPEVLTVFPLYPDALPRTDLEATVLLRSTLSRSTLLNSHATATAQLTANSLRLLSAVLLPAQAQISSWKRSSLLSLCDRQQRGGDWCLLNAAQCTWKQRHRAQPPLSHVGIPPSCCQLKRFQRSFSKRSKLGRATLSKFKLPVKNTVWDQYYPSHRIKDQWAAVLCSTVALYKPVAHHELKSP